MRFMYCRSVYIDCIDSLDLGCVVIRSPVRTVEACFCGKVYLIHGLHTSQSFTQTGGGGFGK